MAEVLEDFSNVWQRADFTLYPTDKKYRVVFSAQYENTEVSEGDIAIDDVSFTPSCRFVTEEPTSSTSTSTQTTPVTTTQISCPDNQFACADGQTCIDQTKVCDFYPDCPDNTDEASCPAYELFDECADLNQCHWIEDNPDGLDFQVIKVQDLNQELTDDHGPYTDPMNSTEGSLVLILASNPDEPDMSKNTASMTGPMHQNSMSECYLEFWYYMAGNTDGAALNPILLTKNKSHEVFLDQLKPDSDGVGLWRKSINGIGRQRGEFWIKFFLDPKSTFDAGVAIDDVGYVACGRKPAEDECPNGFFHCVVSKACVPLDQLCDLTDQCGDNSDEEVEQCHTTVKETFENDEEPLGVFTQNSDHADFEWSRGSGQGVIAAGPPFDHTTFDDTGHYLFIKVLDLLKLLALLILFALLNLFASLNFCFSRFADSLTIQKQVLRKRIVIYFPRNYNIRNFIAKMIFLAFQISQFIILQKSSPESFLDLYNCNRRLHCACRNRMKVQEHNQNDELFGHGTRST